MVVSVLVNTTVLWLRVVRFGVVERRRRIGTVWMLEYWVVVDAVETMVVERIGTRIDDVLNVVLRLGCWEMILPLW